MKVFFDASVLLAGAKSKSGGSRVILQLAEKGKIDALTSRIVLEEVKRNLKKKFSQAASVSCARWLKATKPGVINVGEKEIRKYLGFVAAKDAHVLAAAKKGKAGFLVTLDKSHLLKLKAHPKIPFQILTPRELIKQL